MVNTVRTISVIREDTGGDLITTYKELIISSNPYVKRTVSRDGYCLNILISILSVYDGFQCPSKAFHYPTIINFLFVSL
jgi:hypothetical protein